MRQWIALVLLAISVQVSAVGLGKIQVLSGQKQAFDARIPVIGTEAISPKLLEAKVGKPEFFEAAGLQVHPYLKSLGIKVVPGANNSKVIHLSSPQIPNWSVLQFLITLSWPDGSITRNYLIVPAMFGTTDNQTAKPIAQSTEPPKEIEQPRYGPTKLNETLYSIAKKLRPNDSVTINQVMVALFKANPSAFSNSDIYQLKAEQFLVIPSIEAIKNTKNIKEAPKDIKASNQVTSTGRPQLTHNTELKTLVAPHPDSHKQKLPTQNLAREAIVSVEPKPLVAKTTENTQPSAVANIEKNNIEAKPSVVNNPSNEKAKSGNQTIEWLSAKVTSLEEENEVLKNSLKEYKDTITEQQKNIIELNKQKEPMPIIQISEEEVMAWLNQPIYDYPRYYFLSGFFVLLFLMLILRRSKIQKLKQRVYELELKSFQDSLEEGDNSKPTTRALKKKAKAEKESSKKEDKRSKQAKAEESAKTNPKKENKKSIEDVAKVDKAMTEEVAEKTPSPAHLAAESNEDIASQLDLARAYISMNQYNQAKPILEIALSDGNELEKQEAQVLLKRIKSSNEQQA